MENRFCLRLLDNVQVEQDGQLIQGFESRKALALFCYLVVQHRPIQRSQLVDMFWPDKAEGRGRGNLSRVLSGLRDLLPGYLQTDQAMVFFAPPGSYWVDVFHLGMLANRDDVTAHTAATALYKRDFMEGFFLNDCPEFETWLVTQQEYWRQKVIECLLRLIEHHTFGHGSDYRRGLDYAGALLALELWREEAHRHKMRLLAYSGQRSAALAHYRTCRALLAQELGVEPSGETSRLFEQIRDGQLAGAEARPLIVQHVAPDAAFLSTLFHSAHAWYWQTTSSC